VALEVEQKRAGKIKYLLEIACLKGYSMYTYFQEV